MGWCDDIARTNSKSHHGRGFIKKIVPKHSTKRCFEGCCACLVRSYWLGLWNHVQMRQTQKFTKVLIFAPFWFCMCLPICVGIFFFEYFVVVSMIRCLSGNNCCTLAGYRALPRVLYVSSSVLKMTHLVSDKEFGLFHFCLQRTW